MSSPSHVLRSSHLRPGLPNGLVPSRFSTKNLYAHLTCLPYVLHNTPISFFFIASPESYLATSIDHKPPRHAAFSTPPLPRPPLVLTCSTATFKHSQYMLLLQRERRGFTSIQNYRQTGKGKILHLTTASISTFNLLLISS
jgi:hypothetical protein